MGYCFTQEVSFTQAWDQVITSFLEEDDVILLESQEEEVSDNNRYAILCVKGLFRIEETRDGVAKVINLQTNDINLCENGFKAIDDILALYKIDKTQSSSLCPMFTGGMVGFISYDRQQHLPKKYDDFFAQDSYIGLPLLCMVFYPEALIYDKKTKVYTVVSCRSKQDLSSFIRFLKQKIAKSCTLKSEAENYSKLSATGTLKKNDFNNHYLSPNVTSSQTREDYISGLRVVHEQIRQGEVYQINYTQRFLSPLKESALDLYRRLKLNNPAPYAAFLKIRDFEIVCASPERFIKVRVEKPSHKTVNNLDLCERTIITCPIKGTIKRTHDKEQDEKLALSLLHSKKDRSELLMIVDLERNDLSKICTYGSVQVPELFKIEGFPTLFHLVAKVEGKLKQRCSWQEILEATFPGGSITGAPKLAAMECIAKLEKVPRELYTGSIGYISTSGEAELNIVIRTVICHQNQAYYSTGGGIVWDSDNDSEYEESLLKAKALQEALQCFD